MKSVFFSAGPFLTFFLFFGCNSSQMTSNDPDGFDLTPGQLITQNILHNGDEREYQLYLPSSYNEGTAYLWTLWEPIGAHWNAPGSPLGHPCCTLQSALGPTLAPSER